MHYFLSTPRTRIDFYDVLGGTEIVFICGDDDDVNTEPIYMSQQNDPCVYTFQWTHRAACKLQDGGGEPQPGQNCITTNPQTGARPSPDAQIF